MKRTNSDLKKIYDKVHLSGNFFSIPSKDITESIVSRVDWRGKNVLEVGCGTGETSFAIAKSGAKKVVGVDYSVIAIDKAKKSFCLPNLFFKCMDLEKVDGFFDVVVAQEVLEHLDNPFKFLNKVSKLSDFIIVSCPSFLNPRGYVWMALNVLLDVPMSLTDLHYLSWFDFKKWADRVDYGLSWGTILHEHSLGKPMVKNMRHRLFNALFDAGFSNLKVDSFIDWFDKAVLLEKPNYFNGVCGIYIFKKKKVKE